MKKIISLLIIFVMVATCLVGCGSEETWMPYDLEFGMTYDEAKEVFVDIPELKDAASNDGYLTKNYSPEDEEINAYFEFLKPASFPGYAFSFNEDKELYEFYCANSYSFIQDNPESSAENLYNSFVDFYNEKTDIKAKENEYSDGLKASWETEEVVISVCMVEREDSYYIYAVVHNKEFELKD